MEAVWVYCSNHKSRRLNHPLGKCGESRGLPSVLRFRKMWCRNILRSIGLLSDEPISAAPVFLLA